MQIKFLLFTAYASFVLLSVVSTAHELPTHALITDRAYQLSVLNPQSDGSIIPLLGFDRLDYNHPFAWRGIPGRPWPVTNQEIEGYYDDVAVGDPGHNFPPYFPGSSVSYLRRPQQLERQVFQNLLSGGYVPGASGRAIEQQVRAWLMRGSVREDDNDVKPFPDSLPFWWVIVGKRDTDPYGHILRALKHFYDPYYDRAAQTSDCGSYECIASPAWAMGYDSPFDRTTMVEDLGRRNHFTWRDARNNYWWALTLQRVGTGNPDTDTKNSSAERLHRWATTINDLGHIIHLLQDTSQPQHVRNDMHGPPIAAAANAGAAFEAYTDYRVVRNYEVASSSNWPAGNPLRYMVGENVPTVNYLPRIELGMDNPYPGNGGQVMFSRPAKFFSTRHQEPGCNAATLRSRRGMADFANRNFFTAGTLPGFREGSDPVPGAAGCPVSAGPTYPLPPNDLSDPGFTAVELESGLSVDHRIVFLTEYAYPVSDSIAPGYDQSIHTLDRYGGKVPLVTESMFRDIVQYNPKVPPSVVEEIGYTLTYNNYRYMADVLLPRAVGYSAGMIDYFFRGRLEVTPIDQAIVAVLNQGEPHTMNAAGYPMRVDDPTKVFGFEAVRLQVRNVTAEIVESGTGTVYPQSTGGPDAQMVAIARYHRTECYKPDLSGARVEDYDGTITEPTCGADSVRTDYQEISVSAPLAVAAGELDGAAVAKLFDFSADPIPVNATDLFIQVAYRGPLGEEIDGIALGRYDVSEPSFAVAWNNTDYFWNGSAWMAQNTAHPAHSVYYYWACAGFPSKFVYRYAPGSGDAAMGAPPTPGVVRLAFLWGKPDNDFQRFSVRSVPIMQTSPHAQVRSAYTRGQIRQANLEVVPPAVLDVPYAGCFLSPPNLEGYWCVDPVKRRRGVIMGEIAQPLYYSLVGAGNATDVDSVPLPPGNAVVLRDGGEIRFNDPGPLQDCPMQPNATHRQHHYQALLEEAAWYGVPVEGG